MQTTPPRGATAAASADTPTAADPDRYDLAGMIPFLLVHLACLAAIWTGVDTTAVILAVALYAIRIFAIGAGLHRYFSHRSYKTSRVFAFVLGFLAQSSAQRGLLWWSANHRKHHRYSDGPRDVHSPRQRGFWHAHCGWVFTYGQLETDFAEVQDLAKYPELMWLERHAYLPAATMALVAFLIGGWSGLVVGFVWSTVAVWHATFTINSLAHVFGRARYLTGDDSRNNWMLALLTFGEGWHNNHHHYQSAACQGFRWWEIDLTWYGLKALAALGVVWDLRRPPAEVVRNELPLSRKVVEKAAGQLASSVPLEPIAAELSALLAERRAGLAGRIESLREELADTLDDWRHRLDERLEAARHELRETVQGALHGAHPGLHLGAALPTLAELRARADAMFVRTPSIDDIVERARQILIDDAVEALLQREPMPVRVRR